MLYYNDDTGYFNIIILISSTIRNCFYSNYKSVQLNELARLESDTPRRQQEAIIANVRTATKVTGLCATNAMSASREDTRAILEPQFVPIPLVAMSANVWKVIGNTKMIA